MIYAILTAMIPGVFIPDRDDRFYLLARHRQPVAENLARSYIEGLTSPGDLVLDVFAAAPTVARAAAALGRRAIAVDSNPLVAFAAGLEARLPPPREIEIALARWGEIARPDETLQAHLEAQYASACVTCGQPVIADYFVWSRDLGLPVEKSYRCSRCGPTREPATEADRSRAAEHKPRGFHYHLILERLAALDSPFYNLLREQLDLYTPRNLYALVTLTNKLEAAARDESGRTLLSGLLLHALDIGATLYPTIDALPERKTPEMFLEVNIWRALEQAAEGLARAAPGARPAASSEEVAAATDPTFYVGHGSARALASQLSGAAALVLSSPARLDPSFWELSYLWTRWLLGKSASRALEPFLEEERQRWGWYGSALAASLRDAAQLLRQDGRLVAAFPAGSHGMIEALTMAASPVLRLDSLAFRPHRGGTAMSEFGAIRGDYRLVWSPEQAARPARSAHEVSLEIREAALKGANGVLAARGEPLGFSWLHHAALQVMARAGTLSETLNAPMHPRDNAFQFLRRELEAGLKEGYARDFDHRREPGRVLWLRREGVSGRPLVVRVEQIVREILEGQAEVAATELEDRLLARLPGLLTPETELVDACTQSFAEADDGRLLRRAEDQQAAALLRDQLHELGMRLGYAVRNGASERELFWREEKTIPGSSAGAVAEQRVSEDSHRLILSPHVDLYGLLLEPAAPLRGVVLLQENEVSLTREKLERLPELAGELREAGWEFLRALFVEQLLLSPDLNRARFQLALGLDPPLARGVEQMELF